MRNELARRLHQAQTRAPRIQKPRTTVSAIFTPPSTPDIQLSKLRLCGGQLISDTAIGLFSAMFRSKTAGGRLPNTELSRSLL